MQEDKQDTNRTDVLHQEEIHVEVTLHPQCPVIRKLVAYQLMRHEPANQYTRQETGHRQEYLSRHKVEYLKQRTTHEMQVAAHRTKRQGAESPDDTTGYSDDQSRHLTRDTELLLEERCAYLVERHQ